MKGKIIFCSPNVRLHLGRRNDLKVNAEYKMDFDNRNDGAPHSYCLCISIKSLLFYFNATLLFFIFFFAHLLYPHTLHSRIS